MPQEIQSANQVDLFEIAGEGGPLHFRVRPGTDDSRIVGEVAHGQYYQDALVLVGKGAVVIDVGAHIGSFTLLSAARGARVLAVEPVPANHALLAENVQLNNLQTLVKVFRMAIWSSSCERSLNVADDSTGGSGFYYGKETAPAIPVRCVQLGELMDAEGVTTCDLLKLDCEGAEFEILNSLSQATWRRIDAIVMEYHLFAGYSLEQLWDCLTRQGFLVAVKPLEHVEGILGYVLAVRPSMPSLYQMSVTQAESPLTRLPIVGRLWRVARRPVHRLVVFYLNQLIAAYDRHQRRTYMCLRLLSYQAAQRDGVIHHHRQQWESDSGIGER